MKKDHRAGILLISPPFASFYEGIPVRQGVPYSPTLSLPTLAAGTLSHGIRTHILDANLNQAPFDAIRRSVIDLNPRWVGITVVTPLWEEVMSTIRAVREARTGARIVLGGPHVSAMPKETLVSTEVDAVVFGEGDEALVELLKNDELAAIPGVAVRFSNGEIEKGPERPAISDLDALPMPAWDLYDLHRYQTTKLLSRRSPAGWIETSRGCPFRCVYCSKHTFGHSFRTKSPVRVVDEMAHMLDMGFREIHIADDCFTANGARAKEICELILKRGLKFPWAPVTGIRVDNVDEELLRLMHRAGCYRVYFGIESGSDEILKGVKKGISLEKVKNAVTMSKRVGLETFGFFMIALPGETIETMTQTREFAKELELDMAKMSITIPLPETPLFNQLKKDGRLLATRWSDYNLYRPARTVYKHDVLDWDTVDEHYRLFYRSFYLRPRYAIRRLKYAIKNRTLLTDLTALLKTKW